MHANDENLGFISSAISEEMRAKILDKIGDSCYANQAIKYYG